ncbi:pilus assembly protein TadG-related protein [Cellulomonas carbonis]|uniref:Pilus assembly protein TadE n=1 Tax=Cellulomonas carbonis T26 TaxID=947969 RepID=A0A0A0BL41_9CELL|nr:pilus assembly protein TadG-related protein [Cellulomonas carbonis]KGM08590.1 pilus assembly protein TadE [Cellulomonas carbonis T26]GGC02993.1 membrane protein [Cellulomonas carbonis]
MTAQHRRSARPVGGRLVASAHACRLRTVARGDDGAASVLVLGLVVVLMAVAGLVVDGGRAVNARAALLDAAEQAARAGANQVDIGSLRSGGQVSIDPTAARRAAEDFLVAQGHAPADIGVVATATEVEVHLQGEVETALLSLVLIDSLDVEGSAVARAAVGITDEIGTGAP